MKVFLVLAFLALESYGASMEERLAAFEVGSPPGRTMTIMPNFDLKDIKKKKPYKPTPLQRVFTVERDKNDSPTPGADRDGDVVSAWVEDMDLAESEGK